MSSSLDIADTDVPAAGESAAAVFVFERAELRVARVVVVSVTVTSPARFL